MLPIKKRSSTERGRQLLHQLRYLLSLDYKNPYKLLQKQLSYLPYLNLITEYSFLLKNVKTYVKLTTNKTFLVHCRNFPYKYIIRYFLYTNLWLFSPICFFNPKVRGLTLKDRHCVLNISHKDLYGKQIVTQWKSRFYFVVFETKYFCEVSRLLDQYACNPIIHENVFASIIFWRIGQVNCCHSLLL